MYIPHAYACISVKTGKISVCQFLACTAHAQHASTTHLSMGRTKAVPKKKQLAAKTVPKRNATKVIAEKEKRKRDIEGK